MSTIIKTNEVYDVFDYELKSDSINSLAKYHVQITLPMVPISLIVGTKSRQTLN